MLMDMAEAVLVMGWFFGWLFVIGGLTAAIIRRLDKND